MAAALAGSREIGFTIVSMTLSLVAVFIPLLLMGGLVGRLFREFAVTVSVEILMSGLVSLNLTTMMCAQLLLVSDNRRKEGNDGKERRHPFANALKSAFDTTLNGYAASLRWVLRHR